MALGILFTVSKAAYEKALKRKRAWERHRNKKGVWTGPPVSDSQVKRINRDTSVIEVYRFQHRKAATPFTAYLKGQKVTNWTGLKLCTVTQRSSARSGFGRTERVTVHARCIDGHTYVGRGPGDGMYLNLRPKKGRS